MMTQNPEIKILHKVKDKKPVEQPIQDPTKGPELVTFGCRLNIYESEVMKQHATAAGLDDAIIFNTCAVTNEAERKARQAIRQARKKNPNARIIVTGCAAQIDPEKYAAMEDVDQVIGNDLKLKAETWGANGTGDAKIIVNDIMSVTETAGHLIEGFDGRTRAFLQVQNGCDHRCTFCIIPYGRGNSRSVPIGEIVNQVRMMVKQGFQEIVLTGVDVTSYGPDLPGKPTLGQMIRRVLALVPELPRLRLSSLDPVEMDEDLWLLVKTEPRLMPQLHISLQHGDDMILKRMKRRHLRQDVIDFCKRARDLRPDITFSCDIIAGFPTETEEMFQNAVDLIKECDISLLHVFPYSPRPGTPAAKMPQVNGKIIKARAARLRMLHAKMEDEMLQKWIGREGTILMEKDGIGRTEYFVPVKLAEGQPELEAGQLARVKMTRLSSTDRALIGEIIS